MFFPKGVIVKYKNKIKILLHITKYSLERTKMLPYTHKKLIKK
jgi:hypothetical protein